MPPSGQCTACFGENRELSSCGCASGYAFIGGVLNDCVNIITKDNSTLITQMTFSVSSFNCQKMVLLTTDYYQTSTATNYVVAGCGRDLLGKIF
jgi:hypothetical protein